ncbi:hypothetical protein HDU92_007829 [Lobulomyces angularis]|nr:hypothetical protein HDU92_007829 [Lobulomyces angularis]
MSNNEEDFKNASIQDEQLIKNLESETSKPQTADDHEGSRDSKPLTAHSNTSKSSDDSKAAEIAGIANNDHLDLSIRNSEVKNESKENVQILDNSEIIQVETKAEIQQFELNSHPTTADTELQLKFEVANSTEVEFVEEENSQVLMNIQSNDAGYGGEFESEDQKESRDSNHINVEANEIIHMPEMQNNIEQFIDVEVQASQPKDEITINFENFDEDLQTKAEGGEKSTNDSKFVEFDKSVEGEEFKSGLISSNLNTWHRKLYMGGYRHKETKVEYFHSTTQTTTAQEKKAMAAAPKNHRDTQTKFTRNRISQATVESSTQMTKPGVYVSTETDYELTPSKYVTADDFHAFIEKTVIRIQCFIRRCIACRIVEKKRKEKRIRGMALAAKEKRRKQLAEKRRNKEIESRLHPKTSKDFEILYNGLENWRIQETQKINNANFSEPARLTALADLLDQEASLIQKIDRLKITANEENKELSIVNLLDKMSSPKKWAVHSKLGGFCSVDTPNTIRARELRDLYHALNIPLLSVDERLQILLHVKYTVKEFDCNLTRDIVELIDREGDLVSRGREAKSLEGLRRRISNLFLQFIQTPEFNPESKAHQKFPDAGQSWKREQSVYYCRGCTKYLASTEFYLSTTMRHLGRCKLCTMKENIANQRKDDSCYVEMLKMARGQEVAKSQNDPEDKFSKENGESEQGKQSYNAISLLQESDIRYLVDTIWNRQSAVSGSKKIEELVLTRWNPKLELSPWNVILLTVSEASNHEMQEDPESVYTDEFVRRCQQRHIAAKKHFSSLPYMEKYLKGKFNHKDVNGFNGLNDEVKKKSKKGGSDNIITPPSLGKKEDSVNVSNLSITGTVIASK